MDKSPNTVKEIFKKQAAMIRDVSQNNAKTAEDIIENFDTIDNLQKELEQTKTKVELDLVKLRDIFNKTKYFGHDDDYIKGLLKMTQTDTKQKIDESGQAIKEYSKTIEESSQTIEEPKPTIEPKPTMGEYKSKPIKNKINYKLYFRIFFILLVIVGLSFGIYYLVKHFNTLKHKAKKYLDPKTFAKNEQIINPPADLPDHVNDTNKNNVAQLTGVTILTKEDYLKALDKLKTTNLTEYVNIKPIDTKLEMEEVIEPTSNIQEHEIKVEQVHDIHTENSVFIKYGDKISLSNDNGCELNKVFVIENYNYPYITSIVKYDDIIRIKDVESGKYIGYADDKVITYVDSNKNCGWKILTDKSQMYINNNDTFVLNSLESNCTQTFLACSDSKLSLQKIEPNNIKPFTFTVHLKNIIETFNVHSYSR